MSIIEIRKVTINDAQLLFEWANDLQTRQNSFNSNSIDWPGHIKWLKDNLSDFRNINYLVLLDQMPIGVVKFHTDELTIIGVTVAPEQRGKGLASKIINKACTTFWQDHDNDILAYIKEENIFSIKAFQSAGFQFYKSEFFNNSNCLILKATNNAFR